MDVTQQNNGFGPLAERRGKRAVYASFVALIIFILCTIGFSSEDWHFCVFSFALSTLAILLGELIRRVCLFAEEFKHKNSRYGGSLANVLKTTFSFNEVKTLAVFFIFMSGMVFVYLFEQPKPFSHSQFMALFALNIGVVPLSLFIIGLRELSPVEVSELNERENKNVADGLAWSYYYGYLKLVLPHLEQQINKSEKHRYSINVQKVFILVPKNCNFPPNGKITAEDDRIKLDGSLEPLKISRGGIHERLYKHSVHRIDMPNKEPYYCIAEYATPLLTLFDMSNNPEAALKRDEKDHQCMVFIRKLNEILERDPECRGKCELVAMSGDETKIADILVEHITAARIRA